MDNQKKIEMYTKAITLCVNAEDDEHRAYVEPLWREILESEGIRVNIEDEPRMLETLTLAARKWDAQHDRTPAVMKWLGELIAANVEPAMLQEETEYIKNVMEYMKLNDELKDKEKALDEREGALDGKEEVEQMFPQMEFGRL